MILPIFFKNMKVKLIKSLIKNTSFLSFDILFTHVLTKSWEEKVNYDTEIINIIPVSWEILFSQRIVQSKFIQVRISSIYMFYP